MKQRFNALDIRATVSNLRERLVGIRLQNMYDVNAKTFLFKFSKPDRKELVLIESGVRIHSTQFSREKSATPSDFCAKIRKYLRTRRLTNVRQLGVDRIVDFEFGGGERSYGYHLIAEFYASGNIILTDHEYKIMAILRTVQPNETIKMAVGETYDVRAALTDFQKVDAHQLQTVLRNAGPKDPLKKVLNVAFEYGPAMVEHIILEAGLNPNMKAATELDSSDGSPMLQSLLDAFAKGDEMIASTKSAVPKGYIILQDNSKPILNDEGEEVEIYDEFHPYLYEQHVSRKVREFDTFDGAVDEFFSAIEAQKLELKARQQEESALNKLEAVRREQESRVAGLLGQQMTNTRKAQLIEYNLENVDAAITIIRNAVASQMDWIDLEKLVENEKAKGNPIALMIDGLKLEINKMTLLLQDPYEYESSESDEDDDDEDDKDEDEDEDKEEKDKEAKEVFKVDVDLAKTAFANARSYYDVKKSTASKHEKTIAASSKALKSAERKIRKDLKKTKITATVSKMRKPFWFEKFLWFISNEGHLVIAGRDMQQNEMLVKRYLHKDDVYVHADLHGAASVVVKNKPETPGAPIPPGTLFQAGVMSVCQSKAWDSKIVTSAYWVNPSQVSKSAPTGEYLTTGSFMIRGKKNFLPPVQLVYGFGYLFKLDESSVGNHISEKRRLGLEDDERESDEQGLPEEDTKKSIEFVIETSQQADVTASSDQKGFQEKDTDLKKDDHESEASKEHELAQEEDSAENKSEENDSSTSSSSEDEDEFPDTQLASTNGSKDDWQKYDLEEYGDDGEDDSDNLSQSQAPAKSVTKRAISAKERRLMKKGLTLGEAQTASMLPSDSIKKAGNAKEKVQAPPAPARGRKGKAKKIKEKYGDQDEEERELRMKLLAPDKGPQPKGKKAKREAEARVEKLAKLEKMEQEKKEREMKAKARQEALAKASIDAEKDEDNGMPESSDEKDTEEIRQMLKEENITMLEEDDAANLSALDSLTANPYPEDILHFAIPVCAPYNTLQKYKYKVKLTPGALKRGKAVKQAHSVFLASSDATAREKELIKSVPDMEAINTMMSKVKVSAPNLEASKRKKGGKK